MRAWLWVLPAALAGCDWLVVDTGDGGADFDVVSAGDAAGVDASAVDTAGRLLTALQVEPESLAVALGETARLSVTASYGDGTTGDVTASCGWSYNPPGIVTVAGGVVTPTQQGQTQVTANLHGIYSNAVAVTVAAAAAREARGVWVTRWNYSSAADVRDVVQQLADHGFNQIYFQIRGTADAYYDSTIEPWAKGLSGTLGVDPGWDPLQVAISAAHSHGLELHAWLNTFPAWTCGAALPESSGIAHVLEAHPEWSAVDSGGTPMLGHCSEGYVSLSPGIPAVQDHIAAVVEDIVSRYQVDGIHLDYIRYPGPSYSHDGVSDQRYTEAHDADASLTRAEWQRQQVSATVQKAFAEVVEHRPAAWLSAAVWFVYKNEWGWSTSQGYVDYFQDPRTWSAGGYIDAVAPMIYFPLTDPPGQNLDFGTMLEDHVAGNAGRNVYAGIHGDYDSFTEIADEIDFTRQHGGAGFIVFAYTYLQSHDYWDEMLAGPLATPALPPLHGWR
ncbi:MAG: family 10 glycosylhydrolase [Deltaproteobacteria bacterium]|nr:family 10 glycosylhydrolase [Deltaproteobacteria bacterium]